MTPRRPRRLCWAVSGQGRALQAVLEAADRGLARVEVVAVVTDRPSPIEALSRARAVPCYRIEPDGGPYAPRLVEALERHGAEWLGLTFNRLLSEAVIAAVEGRVFNLHMSPLPLFPGFGAVARTLAAGMRMTAATVHLVDGRTDGGAVLGQAAVAVAAGDTREALGRRLFDAALPLLLQVVRAIGEGEIAVGPGGAEWPRARRAPEGPAHVFPPVDDDLAAFARAFAARL